MPKSKTNKDIDVNLSVELDGVEVASAVGAFPGQGSVIPSSDYGVDVGYAVVYRGRSALVLAVNGDKVNIAMVSESPKADTFGQYIERVKGVPIGDLG